MKKTKKMFCWGSFPSLCSFCSFCSSSQTPFLSPPFILLLLNFDFHLIPLSLSSRFSCGGWSFWFEFWFFLVLFSFSFFHFLLTTFLFLSQLCLLSAPFCICMVLDPLHFFQVLSWFFPEFLKRKKNYNSSFFFLLNQTFSPFLCTFLAASRCWIFQLLIWNSDNLKEDGEARFLESAFPGRAWFWGGHVWGRHHGWPLGWRTLAGRTPVLTAPRTKRIRFWLSIFDRFHLLIFPFFFFFWSPLISWGPLLRLTRRTLSRFALSTAPPRWPSSSPRESSWLSTPEPLEAHTLVSFFFLFLFLFCKKTKKLDFADLHIDNQRHRMWRRSLKSTRTCSEPWPEELQIVRFGSASWAGSAPCTSWKTRSASLSQPPPRSSPTLSTTTRAWASPWAPWSLAGTRLWENFACFLFYFLTFFISFQGAQPLLCGLWRHPPEGRSLFSGIWINLW